MPHIQGLIYKKKISEAKKIDAGADDKPGIFFIWPKVIKLISNHFPDRKDSLISEEKERKYYQKSGTHLQRCIPLDIATALFHKSSC